MGKRNRKMTDYMKVYELVDIEPILRMRDDFPDFARPIQFSVDVYTMSGEKVYSREKMISRIDADKIQSILQYRRDFTPSVTFAGFTAIQFSIYTVKI